MNRIIICFAIILLTFCLASCQLPNSFQNNSTTESSNTDNSGAPSDLPSFTIAGSREFCTCDDEGIKLSIANSSNLGSYSLSDVEFFIESGEDIALIDQNTHTLISYGTGAVTVKARLGDTVSSNTLTVYSLMNPSELASNIDAVVKLNPMLGVPYDVKLNGDIAKFYKIAGIDGFAHFDTDGKLVFTGIKGLSFLFKVTDINDTVIYESFCSMKKNDFSIAIKNSLLSVGLLPHIDADVPLSLLEKVEVLDLSQSPVKNVSELSGLKYLINLKYLNLSGCNLGDLSYISYLDKLEVLAMEYCIGLEKINGGINIVSALNSHPSLKELRMRGSFGLINRNIYDSLFSMILNGRLTVLALDDCWLTPSNIVGFSQTVFFGIDEVKYHFSKNSNKFVAAEGFSHAIVSLKDDEGNPSLNLNMGKVSIIELYGTAPEKYYTPIIADGDLTVNLYSYIIYAPRSVEGIYTPNGNLTVQAKLGSCEIHGGDYGYYVNTHGYIVPSSSPARAIVSLDCTLNVNYGAALLIHGGTGFSGNPGISAKDGDPYKNGDWGGDGADGIYCATLTIASDGITIYGGSGGNGGRGGDGHDKDIFSGGYNGGNGGGGGDGGDAIVCKAYCNDSFYVSIHAGAGGSGGGGGTGFLAGSDGVGGNPGDDGFKILYY